MPLAGIPWAHRRGGCIVWVNEVPMRLLLPLLIVTACSVSAEERFRTDEHGHIVPVYLPQDARFTNPWPAEWEAAFVERLQEHLKAAGPYNGVYGNLSFENEKQAYTKCFIDIMHGKPEPALKMLQADDPDGYNDVTLKVDWYPCFTIRSQVRKYFFFGQYLDPEYKKKMFESARIWTEIDPLRRPNAAFKGQKEGWGPETMNSWVDVRNTDNLRAMRECAVYLMAEETGNAKVAAIYKQRITAYVTALYTTGMGEWDSANYLAHTMVGYVQLYDFAKDPQMKLLGKAAMDYLTAIAAVPYFRGSWCGPNKRDYNNIGPRAGAAGECEMWFADCPVAPQNPYPDWIHFATSPYRPAPAVVELARKNIAKPAEILVSKPSYEGWFKEEGGEDQPETFLTYFLANSYQVGSSPTLHQGDMCGFRLGTYSTARGADTWILASDLKGYKGIATGTNGGDLIAQYRNQIIWMNRKADAKLYLLLPKEVEFKTVGSTVFVKAERTWAALHLINLKDAAVDDAATDRVCFKTEKDGSKKPIYPDWQVWSATASGSGLPGLVMELGEQESHGDFAAFVAAVSAKSKLDLGQLASGKRVDFTGALGDRVGLTVTDEGLPEVWRNGTKHDWKQHWAQYQGADGKPSPITLGWKQGTLTVTAGGKTFTGTVKDGAYTFSNK